MERYTCAVPPKALMWVLSVNPLNGHSCHFFVSNHTTGVEQMNWTYSGACVRIILGDEIASGRSGHNNY